MDADIKLIIKKNLPGQVGEVLKKRLQLCDELEKAVDDLRNTVNNLNKQNTSHLDDKTALRDKLSKHEDLAKREGAVMKREHDADLFELKAQLKASEKFGLDVTNFMHGMSRNIEFRRSMSGTIPVAQPGGYPASSPVSKGETRTAE